MDISHVNTESKFMKSYHPTQNFLKRKTLAVLCKVLLSGGVMLVGAAGEVYASTLRLPAGDDIKIGGDHVNEIIDFSRKSAKLTILSTAKIGHPNEEHSVYGDGLTVIEGGASLMGQHHFRENALGKVGVSASTPVKMDYAGLHDHANVDFDNVILRGVNGCPGLYHCIEPLKLYDDSQATLTARTHIENTEEGLDGLELFDNSKMSIKGSSISGMTDGILVRDNSQLNISGASVAGGSAGMRVMTTNDVHIIGGTLKGTGAGKDTAPSGGLVVGTDLWAPLGAHVFVSDGAVIRGVGVADAGIISESTTWATNTLNVKDSTVIGNKNGVRFISLHDDSGEGLNVFNASHTAIASAKGPAIQVDESAKANLNLSDGTTLNAGNGIALDAAKGSEVHLKVENTQLAGDIVNRGGAVNVSLVNKAGWNGSMKGVSVLNLDKGTRWTATSSSSVGGIINNGLMNVSASGTQRNTVSASSYTGDGGEVHFNSVLEGDGSPTDKLLITGNSSGRSVVTVSNIGGRGSKTINGIELIHINGMAQTDFTQKGRIVAGLYDYTLQHNADKSSWYLTSQGPAPYQAVSHQLRPDTGSYLSNLDAARSMFVTRLRDRAGEMRLLDPRSGNETPTSLWLRQTGIHRSFNDSSGQIKTQSNTYVVQLGDDIAQWNTNDHDKWRLGIMGGYGNSHSNSQSSYTGFSSRGDVDGYSVGLYGTWYADDVNKTGPYVDTWANYSWFNNNVKGSTLTSESYKSKGGTASLEGGYTFRMGTAGGATEYFIEPQAQLIWMGVNGNGITETNGTRVNTQGKTNLQSRLGLKAFMKGRSHNDSKDRTFQPFVEANWIHNTTTPGISMDGESDRQAGASNIGEVKLGLEGRLNQAVQVWVTTGQQMGGKGYADTTATLGVRYSF